MRLLLTALLLSSPAAAQMADCTPSNANLPHDLMAWAAPAQPLTAGLAAATAPDLPVETHMNLRLHPPADVSLARPPEQQRTPEAPHAGLLRLRIEQAGVWRVSAARPVWVDLLLDGKPMATSNFGEMAPCTSIRKVLEFPLQPGDYLLQLSGNPGPDLELMVSLKP